MVYIYLDVLYMDGKIKKNCRIMKDMGTGNNSMWHWWVLVYGRIIPQIIAFKKDLGMIW